MPRYFSNACHSNTRHSNAWISFQMHGFRIMGIQCRDIFQMLTIQYIAFECLDNFKMITIKYKNLHVQIIITEPAQHKIPRYQKDEMAFSLLRFERPNPNIFIKRFLQTTKAFLSLLICATLRSCFLLGRHSLANCSIT